MDQSDGRIGGTVYEKIEDINGAQYNHIANNICDLIQRSSFFVVMYVL